MKSDKDKILALLNEIRTISAGLPKGKANQVFNRCSRITLILKKQKT